MKMSVNVFIMKMSRLYFNTVLEGLETDKSVLVSHSTLNPRLKSWAVKNQFYNSF